MKPIAFLLGLLVFHPGAAVAAKPAAAALVRVTPIGAMPGELCSLDRALLFEDPTGVRILFDPGWTVAGGTDARLGDVHAILVTHHHGDHLGRRRLIREPSGKDDRCDSKMDPITVESPNTNVAEIAAAKNASVVVGNTMYRFLAKKIEHIRGRPTPDCSTQGINNEIVVPNTMPCTSRLSFGGRRTLTRKVGSPGVMLMAVAAQHADEVIPQLVSPELSAALEKEGLSAYGGYAIGYVIRFTTGLVVYLSGDTGPTSDMQTIVRGQYHPGLAVMNIDGINQSGPEEVAFSVDQLIQPNTMMISHTHEVSTKGGHVLPGTRAARVFELVKKRPIYVPLSGVAMTFDPAGTCVSGCKAEGRN